MHDPPQTPAVPAAEVPRLRVLVEHPNSLVRLDLEEELTAAGFEVRSCSGPDSTASSRRCPLLEGGPCPLADEADVILNALGSERVAVYVAQRILVPATAVCVDVNGWTSQRLDAVLADVHTSGPIPYGRELAERLREAVRDAQARNGRNTSVRPGHPG